MKKLFLMLFVLAGISVNAQTSVGGGVLLLNGSTAAELNTEFNLADGQFAISPSLDYFLNAGDNATSLTANLDGHYNLGDIDELNYYPIVGLGYHYYSYSYSKEVQDQAEAAGMTLPDLSGSSIGLNIGGGASYALSDGFKLLGELKYVTQSGGGNLGIVLGVLFSFGG